MKTTNTSVITGLAIFRNNKSRTHVPAPAILQEIRGIVKELPGFRYPRYHAIYEELEHLDGSKEVILEHNLYAHFAGRCVWAASNDLAGALVLLRKKITDAFSGIEVDKRTEIAA